MRARLARSEDPRRIFNVTVEAAGAAGLVGEKRVLDSTPLYDAAATMDTITLIRSGIRALFKVAGDREAELRALLQSGDDYATSAKPQIDWDDKSARQDLVDTRAKDAYALLAHLDGETLENALDEAAKLLATVLGQDLEENDDGTFRIARRVAKDRVISTVDPEARHGHTTSARGFDGYKGHVAIDPDSEIVTETVVTPGNKGDASVAEELISDLAEPSGEAEASDLDDLSDADAAPASPAGHTPGGGRGRTKKVRDKEAAASARAARRLVNARARAARRAARTQAADANSARRRPAVFGDAAYGTGAFLDHLATSGITSYAKTQPPVALHGRFAKDRFTVDLGRDQVTCPNGITAAIRRNEPGGHGMAHFGEACTSCPLRARCTTSADGRTISVGRYEHRLQEARNAQLDPAWREEYRATRPKVERKLGHLMFRKHGGRRARVRGQAKVDADFNLLAAAHNLGRLATLGMRWERGRWSVAGA